MASQGALGLRWGVALLCMGCGPVVGVGEPTSDASEPSTDEGTDSATPTTTVGTTIDPSGATTFPPTTTGTTGEPDPTQADVDSGSESCGFICDEGGADDLVIDCDPWAQDCAEEEKCMPWANDGSAHWNTFRCAPLALPAGHPGDPCLVEGSGVSGIDDCDLHAMCFWVDPANNTGTCVAACSGSEADPSCDDPATVCVTDFDGTINLCLPPCDPLLADCVRGTCFAYGHPDAQGFACGVAIAPSLEDFEPCEFDWDCTPGSMCSRESRPAACDDGACCTPLCDLLAPDTCGPDRVCTSVFPEGEAPPSLDANGYCAL